MKLSHLLSQRADLLKQVRLANLAFAYQTLTDFVTRIERARLRGRVTLQPVDPALDRYCPALTALAGSQAVIEEHFAEDDLLLLADVIGFATGHPGFEITFQLEELDEFVAPLRAELQRAGVALDAQTAPQPEQSNQS